MTSMSRVHARERAAQAQYAAAQHVTAQKYKAAFEAKNELALATVTASKVTGKLLLDCLAHAASEHMKVLDAATADPNDEGCQHKIASLGLWSAAAAAVCISPFSFSRQ